MKKLWSSNRNKQVMSFCRRATRLAALGILAGLAIKPAFGCAPTTPITSTTYDIDLNAIKASASTPVNSVLGTYEIMLPGRIIYYFVPSSGQNPGFAGLCAGALYLANKLSLSSANGWAVTNNISSTSVPGLGARVSLVAGSSTNYLNTKWGSLHAAAANQVTVILNIPAYTWKVELIKTGPLGSGTLPVGTTLATLSMEAPPALGGGSELAKLRVKSAASIIPISCSLSNTSINVVLSSISADKLTAVGTTTGDKSFNVNLDCDKDTKVSVSLAGTQNAETTETSVLALTSAGQSGIATGVGVQLLYDGTALKRGTNVRLKTASGGKETLSFSARYYQTKKDVTVGRANTTATLNITYQ